MTSPEEPIVEIEKLDRKGKGIGSWKEKSLLVPHALPGDRVKVRLFRKKKRGHRLADLEEVLQAGPHRTTPRCRHSGTCGGCKWQEGKYASQLEFKRELVARLFMNRGNFDREIQKLVAPTLPSPQVFYYRNKMEFSFARQRWLTREEIDSGKDIDRAFALGLHIPGRFDKVLDLKECHLPGQIAVEILHHTRSFFKKRSIEVYSTRDDEGYLRYLMIREGKKTEEVMVNVVTRTDRPDLMEKYSHSLTSEFSQITTVINNVNTRKSMVATGDFEKVYYGPGVIREKLGDFTFEISAGSFFQTNTYGAEKLYEQIVKMAQLSPEDVVYDLFCGTGAISIFLAPHVKSVLGIEIVESAVEDGQKNASQNGVENCRFLLGDLTEKLKNRKEWMSETGPPDVLVIDPPRPGIHPKALKALAEFTPQKIIYTSCNPLTQAEDLRDFLALRPEFQITALQPVDMFPHTPHIENIALLEKK